VSSTKCFWNLPSSFTHKVNRIPDVFDVINVPGLRYFSTCSKLIFDIKSLNNYFDNPINSSIFAMSSVVFPRDSVSKLLTVNRRGFDFKALPKCSFTKRLRTALLSNVNPFSFSFSSLGTISKVKLRHQCWQNGKQFLNP
jgi:hypothetical protein